MASHIKKRRHSKFYSFPPEIQEAVKALYLEPTTTIQDVVDFLKSKGIDWSKSGAHRHQQWFISEIRDLDILRDQAAMLLADPEHALDLERLTATMLTKRIAVAMQDTTFDVLKHAKLIDAFAKLQRASTQREQYQNDVRTKVNKTADAVAKIAKAKGMDKNGIELIKQKVQGIRV